MCVAISPVHFEFAGTNTTSMKDQEKKRKQKKCLFKLKTFDITM